MKLQQKRVLLVHPGIYEDDNPRLFPPWGIIYVGEALRREGADVIALDLNGKDIATVVERTCRDMSPDVVGITAKLGRGASRMRDVVRATKEVAPEAAIVVGGPLVALYPTLEDQLWNDVTALLWGDGEALIPSWMASGCPRGVYGPAETPSLDTLGIPTWWPDLRDYVRPAECWPNMGVPSLHVSAARGCTRRCTFCYLNRQYPGSHFRSLSPDRLLSSLDQLNRTVGASGFYFVDDCFVDSPPERVRAFCQRLISVGVPYRLGCDIQLSELSQPTLLTELHAAGFRCFYLGIEAASPMVRKRLGKASIHEPIERAVRRLTDMGFFIRASIGVGWPGESLAEMNETLALVERLPDLLFDAYRYAPLEGVPLTNWRGRGASPRASSPFEDYSVFSTNHSQVGDEEIEGIWKSLRQIEAKRLRQYFGSAESN